MAPHADEIAAIFGASTVEEVSARLGICAKSSDWAKKQLETLRKMVCCTLSCEIVNRPSIYYIFLQSPVSLKVSHRLMQRGQQLSLRDDLVLEYGIACRMLENKDFYEGVRAGNFRGLHTWF